MPPPLPEKKVERCSGMWRPRLQNTTFNQVAGGLVDTYYEIHAKPGS